MAKITTIKENRYTQIDNQVIYHAQEMSFESLGVFVYCLAREGSWEMSPKEMQGKRSLGRDRSYKAFSEIIEAGYMIRLYAMRQVGSKNLPGEVSYVVCDNYETMKQKAMEIADSDDSVVYMDCSPKFGIEKKKFIRSSSRDADSKIKEKDPEEDLAEFQYPEIPYTEVPYTENTDAIYKDSAIAVLLKKTTTDPGSVAVESPQPASADAVVVFSAMQSLAIPENVKIDICSQHTEEQVNTAIAAMEASKVKIRCQAAFLRSALKEGYSLLSTESEQDLLVKELQEIYAETSPALHKVNVESIPQGIMTVYQSIGGKIGKFVISLKSMPEKELRETIDLAANVRSKHRLKNEQKATWKRLNL